MKYDVGGIADVAHLVKVLQEALDDFNRRLVSIEKSTGGPSSGSGVDHALLQHLGYTESAHTGFQASLGYTAENIANKGVASGYASLNSSTKVIEDPANATATPTASKIPIADTAGRLDEWLSYPPQLAYLEW